MTKAPRKRTSLAAVFDEAEPALAEARPQRAEPRLAADNDRRRPATRRAEPPRAEQRPGRAVKQQTAYLPLTVHAQLRRLAFEEEVKMHDLLMEGLDRVFADRGLKSLAELEKD